ncbi:3-methyl-2-oxobutanoate hydroxymethyltransferase [Candidatus Poribacteria bacterium]|nr:3-methyl-2-oxobutanoate hydroxymethyltransferase [Candidatus Poribacteria bacterium]
MDRDIDFLMSKKQAHQKITMLTCYDYPTALLEDKAGIDIIFVADSVGTNVLGYESATEVTMENMIHHLKAVRRGVTHAYLLVDMPYKSYDTPKIALENATTFLSHGADGVKLEGWSEKEEVIKILAENNIEVCAHIGYNPQIHSRAWTHGVTFSKAKALIQSALTLENAGAKMIVLEMVSEEVSKIITEKLSIPTIGIGAGKFCDGQVLVINDMLGITALDLRHAKKYQNYQNLTFQAICQYKEEVENGVFPNEASVVSMDEQKLARVEKWLKGSLS